MAKCRAGTYTKSDVVVLSAPLVCYGGFGQPRCPYFWPCKTEAAAEFRANKAKAAELRLRQDMATSHPGKAQ